MRSLTRIVTLAGVLSLTALTGACSSTASSSPPPRTAAPVSPDGGLPPPAPGRLPLRKHKKGRSLLPLYSAQRLGVRGVD